MKSLFAFLFMTQISICGFAAATLNTQCTKNADANQIDGINTNLPYTIASVTKVFTTHWAIAKLGTDYRFRTNIHITNIGNNTFNVHLEGDLYPYFDKNLYQFLAGELNKLKVSNINILSFDENFLYATNVRNDPNLAHKNDDVTPDEIIKQLQQDTLTLNKDLSSLNAKALATEGLTLPAAVSININTIQFVKKVDFTAAPNTVSFYLNSSELDRNLKEMNRNSNNFAADKFFKKLSTQENYPDFILHRLQNVRPEEITLYNGSGYPVVINANKVYNEASCSVVLDMMSDLRNSLIAKGKNLKDILPVAGKDSIDDGDSTITQIYGNEKTSGSLLGKTGSVLDTIALAGLVATENENLFFQTSFKVDATPEDRALAYSKIKDWLENTLIKDKKKTDLADYKPKTFLPFDKNSSLKRISAVKIYN